MNDGELRKLDAWIAKHVTKKANRLGDKVIYEDGDAVIVDLNGNFAQSVNCYTTNPAAAMEVLKACADVCLDEEEPKSHPWFRIAKIRDVYHIDCHPIYIESETFELAICLFAKKLFSK